MLRLACLLACLHQQPIAGNVWRCTPVRQQPEHDLSYDKDCVQHDAILQALTVPVGLPETKLGKSQSCKAASLPSTFVSTSSLFIVLLPATVDLLTSLKAD